MRKFYNILVIGPMQTHVDGIFEAIESLLDSNPWCSNMVKSSRKSPIRTIAFKNGSTIKGITAGSSSNKKGEAARGKGANIILIDEAVYLNDDDWAAFKAIMKGDKYLDEPPRTFIASTTTLNRGVYYSLFKNPKSAKIWNRIHIPITENPDYNERDIEEAKLLCTSEAEWQTEYLAEFPEIGQNVFPLKLISKSMDPSIDYQASLELARQGKLTRKIGENFPLITIGVDWDKYNKDGHGPNISIVSIDSNYQVTLIYREEIPQSISSYQDTIKRIIVLDEYFNSNWIYVDRGHGDSQVEQLQDYGQRNPKSGIADKIIGIHFNQNVEVQQPLGGVVKKKFKQVMVNIIQKWMETDKLKIPDHTVDSDLYNQLKEYHIVRSSETGVIYSSEKDHAIASLGLALMAIFERETYQPEEDADTPLIPRELSRKTYEVDDETEQPMVEVIKKAPDNEKEIIDKLQQGNRRVSSLTGFSRTVLPPRSITRHSSPFTRTKL